MENKHTYSECEDTDEGYAYFRERVNWNKDDCCNLRKGD